MLLFRPLGFVHLLSHSLSTRLAQGSTSEIKNVPLALPYFCHVSGLLGEQESIPAVVAFQVTAPILTLTWAIAPPPFNLGHFCICPQVCPLLLLQLLPVAHGDDHLLPFKGFSCTHHAPPPAVEGSQAALSGGGKNIGQA